MSRLRVPYVGAVACLSLLLVGAECDDTAGSLELDLQTVQSFLDDNADKAPVFMQVFEDVLTVLDGTPVEGITLTPDGNIMQAIIEIDLDGDMTRETTVSGSATFSSTEYSFEDPVDIEITDIDHPTVGGAVSATAQSVGGTAIEFTGDAFFTSPGNPTVDIPDFGFTYDYFGNVVFGWACLEVGSFSAEICFEPDGLGGWQMRVSDTDCFLE
ncbi:MAG: hypothetical protein PVG79_04295 [Gemmatimonadales bacterium]|jgi:hypothetical protein